MLILALLSGGFVACAVYLLFADESWRRLAGLALLGNGLALLAVAAGEGAPSAIRNAVGLVLISFALFLAYASFVRIRRKRVDSTSDEARR